jgi:hypothetical protein
VRGYGRPPPGGGVAVFTPFCNYTRPAPPPPPGRGGTAAHPGTFVISLDNAAELARRHAARVFGATST